MTTLVLCLFIACLLPYLAKIPVAIAMSKQPGGYDNNHPRAQQALLTGFGGRAAAAHENSFESLLIYSTAVLTAISTHHTNELIRNLAIAYLVVRVAYHIIYLMNWASLRSFVWGISYIISLSIIWLCL